MAGGADRLSRGFVAIPVPPAHQDRLQPFLEACTAQAPGFRWVPAGNLHLTLRFLGPVGPELLGRLRERLATIQAAGFELELGDPGSFRRRGKASVLWLGLARGAEPAKQLAAAVEALCRESGLAAEERAFRPHITLARARSRAGEDLVELPQLPALGSWRAPEFVLFDSHTGRGGAVYEPVACYPLG